MLSTIAFFFLFTCCSRNREGDNKKIFRYNQNADISTLDPAYAKDQALGWACSQLYNGLIELDSNLQVRPSIAKDWDISEDGSTYTFHLRNDVFFHKNGIMKDSTRAVTAQDVLYSFNRILDPKVASPGLWIFSEVAPDGFLAPNDSTFIIKLKHSFAPFLSLLSMPYCYVVPKEIVEYYGEDFRKHPIGTGPFKFQMWKENVKLVMRRNPDYFEKDENGNSLPYLDGIATTFIVDKQTVFLEFVKGNLDFMNSLDASYKDEILTRTGQLKKKYADKINMYSEPFLNTEYLGFLMEGKSILSNKLIRQAINYGFDRVKMMKYLRNGIGTPGCQGMIPKGLPGWDSCSLYGYSYNPTKAKQLLKEAGYPNGKGLPTIKMTTTASYLDLCKYIQQQLNLIGINVEIDVNPPASLREVVAQSKCNWFRGSWIADYPDAENYLSLFYSENFCPDGPNYTHFKNEEFDKLYRKSQSETSNQKRTELYRKMDSIVMEEAPVVVLYYDQILHFTHKNIHGLRSNAMNALDLRRVTKD